MFGVEECVGGIRQLKKENAVSTRFLVLLKGRPFEVLFKTYEFFVFTVLILIAGFPINKKASIEIV